MEEIKLKKDGTEYKNKPGAGRPTGTGTGKINRHYMQVSFNDEIYALINEEAEKQDKSAPHLVRSIVKNYFKKDNLKEDNREED